MRIAIVDDERPARSELRHQIQELLKEAEIVEGDSGAAALQIAGDGRYELFFLDINLGDISGTVLVNAIHNMQPQAKIIFVTAYSEYAVEAFELGVEDYVMKPFDTKELVARIKAVLRRYQASPAAAVSEPKQQGEYVEYPDLIVNLTNYSVIYKGHSIEMPPKELELLYFLASSPNQVFTREQLLDHIWGYEYIGDTRTVDVHIKRLREKIKDHASWAITTVWGIGYKFEVKR